MDALFPPAPLPQPTTILQVRAGKIQTLGKAGLLSAIFKTPQSGPQSVTEVGLADDQQQYAVHGGVDKALHQYCAAHYPTWRSEKPDKAHLFDAGAFGENFVSNGLDEDCVCIGDVFSVGKEVRVQVSEPRMPCYKLNHRFEWSRCAVRVQKTGRTGWYLRVLRTGKVQEGDEMVLSERRHPRWSISAAQRVLFREEGGREAVEQLGNLKELGKEIRELLKKRLEEGRESEKGRLQGLPFDWQAYKLVARTNVTPRIKSLVFAAEKKAAVSHPEFGPFAYVSLKFGPDDCFERSYSVVSGSMFKFTLGIALDDNSRGGSRYLHEQAKIGDRISVARGYGTHNEQNEKRLRAERIRRRIFIVGGIGITAFLREIRGLEAIGEDFEVHYAVRSLADAAYRNVLPTLKTTYYAKDQGKRLDLQAIIPRRLNGSNINAVIYCCGPTSLMEACRELTDRLGYPEHMVHFESFGGVAAEPSGDPFEVEICDTGSLLHVPDNKSLLQVLNEAGFDIQSSCKVGNCGLCAVDYCEGKVDHKGIALTREQKTTSLLSCVSRGKGRIKIELD